MYHVIKCHMLSNVICFQLSYVFNCHMISNLDFISVNGMRCYGFWNLCSGWWRGTFRFGFTGCRWDWWKVLICFLWHSDHKWHNYQRFSSVSKSVLTCFYPVQYTCHGRFEVQLAKTIMVAKLRWGTGTLACLVLSSVGLVDKESF